MKPIPENRPAARTETRLPDVVAGLRELLGEVVLLGWPIRSKGNKRPWKHLTTAHMTPDYLCKLDGGNIGVALGAKSGNLCAIDVDDDKLVPEFLELNPLLAETLQTHGSRGMVFWLRMAGSYPQKTFILKNSRGESCGEFRSNGSQSIIHGIHPNGNPYQIRHRAKPAECEFSEIVWPSGFSVPNHIAGASFDLDTEDTEDTEETEDLKEVSGGFLCVNSIDDVLARSKPIAHHTNYQCALKLARGVKTLERLWKRQFEPQELQAIHRQWMNQAAPFLRPGQSADVYLIEFLNAYQLAKHLLESTTMAEAVKRAKADPLPPQALGWTQNKEIRFLTAVCRELQAKAGAEPFYLSVRMARIVLGHDTHAGAARYLRALCAMKALIEVKKGSGKLATRYRYVGK